MRYGSLMSAYPADTAQMLKKEGFGDRDESSSETMGLVLRAQAGDREAFEELMILHQRLVMGTAFHILHRIEDARDAAQEVFLVYSGICRASVGKQICVPGFIG